MAKQNKKVELLTGDYAQNLLDSQTYLELGLRYLPLLEKFYRRGISLRDHESKEGKNNYSENFSELLRELNFAKDNLITARYDEQYCHRFLNIGFGLSHYKNLLNAVIFADMLKEGGCQLDFSNSGKKLPKNLENTVLNQLKKKDFYLARDIKAVAEGLGMSKDNRLLKVAKLTGIKPTELKEITSQVFSNSSKSLDDFSKECEENYLLSTVYDFSTKENKSGSVIEAIPDTGSNSLLVTVEEITEFLPPLCMMITGAIKEKFHKRELKEVRSEIKKLNDLFWGD